MINIIVAHGRRKGIGIGNKLPWLLKKDIVNFKNLTIGDGNNSVIMGRRTWDSLPKSARPLPNRYNIVVSKSIKLEVEMYPNCKVVSSITEALDYSKKKKFDKTWAIGGAGIYDGVLEHGNINEIHVTNVDSSLSCDTFFPDITKDYDIIQATPWMTENNLDYRFEIHIKRMPVLG